MSRYIDADRFIEWLDVGHLRTPCEKCHSDYDVKEMIDSQQTADVQEVRHGRWIYCGHHEFHGHVFECSVCGRYLFANSKEDVYWEYPYCHCGAKMESVEGLEEN